MDFIHMNRYDLVSNNEAQSDFIKTAKLEVYPNPAQNELNVSLTGIGSSGVMKVWIINSLGQIIQQLENSNRAFKIDTSGDLFTNGVYTIKVEQRDIVLSKRFIGIK